jgi:uncharacterized protein (TIGR03067 family)
MFTAAFVLWLVAAPADLSDAVKKELKAIEGDWIVVAMDLGGTTREFPKGEQIPVTIKGTKFTFGKFGDGEVTALDPSLKPKIVDFKMLRKPESGVTNEAIFKVEKDTLVVVVYLGEDKKRPASFDVPKDDKTARFTLKRNK